MLEEDVSLWFSSVNRNRNTIWKSVRIIFLFLFLITIIMISEPTPLFTYIGMVFALAGETVRFWASGYLVKSKELAIAGPFRHMQHPFNLGGLLSLTGIGFMAILPYYLNLVLLSAGYLIFFLLYFPKKLRKEDQRLRNSHGEQWVMYKSSVPTLFPRIQGYGEAEGGWSSERMLRNREHYMIFGITFLVFIFLWKSYLS